MSTTSADPGKLHAFVNGVKARAGQRRDRASRRVARLSASTIAACDGYVTVPALGALATLLDDMGENETFVADGAHRTARRRQPRRRTDHDLRRRAGRGAGGQGRRHAAGAGRVRPGVDRRHPADLGLRRRPDLRGQRQHDPPGHRPRRSRRVAGALEHRPHVQLGRRRSSPACSGRDGRRRSTWCSTRDGERIVVRIPDGAVDHVRADAVDGGRGGRGDRQPPLATRLELDDDAGCVVHLDHERRLRFDADGAARPAGTPASPRSMSNGPDGRIVGARRAVLRVGRIDVAWDGDLISVAHRPPTVARSRTAATRSGQLGLTCRPHAGDAALRVGRQLLLVGHRQRRRRRVRQRVRRRRPGLAPDQPVRADHRRTRTRCPAPP